uniref:Holin n=1 Tax=viral metagenome TaxID=1070528 RepID=A0A6M3Y605_9ZZZZ
MDELQALIGLGGVAVVAALVQVYKGVFPSLPEGLKPMVAIVLGIGWNVGVSYAITQSGGTGLPYAVATVMGIIAGLAASGVYSTQKALRS